MAQPEHCVEAFERRLELWSPNFVKDSNAAGGQSLAAELK
jgi:hypothetical protein